MQYSLNDFNLSGIFIGILEYFLEPGILYILLEYCIFYTQIFKKRVGLEFPDCQTFYRGILDGFIGY